METTIRLHARVQLCHQGTRNESRDIEEPKAITVLHFHSTYYAVLNLSIWEVR